MVTNEELKLIHELREQGVDWDTISDTIPNFTDNDRKLFYGYKLGMETNDDASLIKHAKTLQRIRLARKQLGIERSINNEQIRDITLHQTFTDQVMDAIENRFTEFTVEESFRDFVDFDKVHIFTMSDFHYDGDTDYLDVIKRATEQIKRVIDEKQIEDIVLVELGDTVDGASLRTSQLMAIKKGMVNQVIDVADAYIKMLSYLDSYVNITFISVDSSNHTQLRNLGTKQNQLVEEDLMLVFNKIIRTALPDLDMITGEDIVLNLCGFNFFFAHGHLVKSKEKYLETLQAERNIQIDFGFFGHFHHQRSIDLHSAYDEYDKRAFYVPALSTRYSPYEKDKNLSSCAGVGYYVFKRYEGHVEERKLKI